ncbi:MAG: DUF1801 domain-containing protein [Flavobacteriaceae bacterium]
MNPLETYFITQREPLQSVLLYLRQVVFETIPNVEEKYKYKIPMYYYKGKSICYLNILKGTNYVDFAFIFGYKLSNKQGLLKDGRNRQYTRSIAYPTLESIAVFELKEILLEAISFIDEK